MTPALLKTFFIGPNSLTKEDLHQADDDRDHHHIILVEDVRLVVSPGKLDTEDSPHKHANNEGTTTQPLAKAQEACISSFATQAEAGTYGEE